ncbi:MAG TPA: TIGR04084 family radical SAM/SPASM domain-containing protein [Methanoculleus sp.]|nr:TIGR04084 family radical SAM/SPASM domain-containing protein [Methanoculleus sp.]
MHFHLVVTDQCNLCCSYCRGRIFDCPEPEHAPSGIALDADLPVDLAIDLATLYAFLAQDPDATLTFYGGEPLMRSDLVAEIALNAPVKAFGIHTNGTLLHTLDPDVIDRLSTILVSIDGPEELTDRQRGAGTFARVTDNLRKIMDGGFSGEIIGRMTVTEATDIAGAVRFLADNEQFPFASIHWQMDANFWYDYHQRDFGRWLKENYNPGITLLAADWVETMRTEGRVVRLYPFLDTMQDMLFGRPSRLRCGCGHSDYSVMTDGSILPCPIMVGMKDYCVGHIASAHPLRLPRVDVGAPCTGCALRDFCGGRCLYASITKPWPEEGRNQVCSSVAHLHRTMKDALPEVRRLIRCNAISLQDFDHEKFNSCEIIP